MEEKGQIQIGMPALWLAEMIQDLEENPFPESVDYFFSDPKGEKLDKEDLKFSLGGEEIIWTKLAFEAGVATSIGFFITYIIERAKRIFKRHVDVGEDTPEYIEIMKPDGTRLKFKREDLD